MIPFGFNLGPEIIESVLSFGDEKGLIVTLLQVITSAAIYWWLALTWV